MSFDEVFDEFEARELARRVVREYFRGLESDIDREIGLLLYSDRIGEQATNEDIIATLEVVDLREIESLYGRRVRVAADRGRSQRNHSALECFVREVRRARSDMRACAMAVFGAS